MKIAVLSGKGGTGKTFLSVNLAAAANKSMYIDCDIEEPNGHLFFKPTNIAKREVSVKIPKVDKDKCIGCRNCVDFCKFNALAFIKSKPMVFEEVCHSCGGCMLFCTSGALSEIDRNIGYIHEGFSDGVKISSGILNIGEASGVPIIEELLDEVDKSDDLVIIDCPPGSNCTVMESIKYADYALIVAEPTIFGLHNLKMIYELLNLFNIPFGIVINKYTDRNNPIIEFAKDNNIKIIYEIPFDKNIGKINSNGKIISRVDENYNNIFLEILNKVKEEVHRETVINS